MNVAVDSRKVTDGKGNLMERKCLVAKKDFTAGDLIYSEQPVVATLDADLEGKGTHCSYCIRSIEKGMAITSDQNGLSSVYCSKDCQLKAKSQYETLFFSLDSVIPAAIAAQSQEAPIDNAARKEAQAQYIAYLKESTKTAPLLVAKILGLQVEVEMSKLMLASERKPSSEYADEEYSIHDHLERLRYLEVTPPAEESGLLAKVLATAMPGLDQFISDERYAVLLGKMMYNSFGVCYGGGRDDRPASIHRPEDVERTRTSYGTARQLGSAFFKVSSYLVHSCAPTGRVSFQAGTSELHLFATTDIKKGEEITVAYVDVAQHDGESVMESRRRRRIELARGWRFACTCKRCIQESQEAEENSLEDKVNDDVGPIEDGSKVDKAVENFEQRMKGGLM
jgi:import receptor subunit TOM20